MTVIPHAKADGIFTMPPSKLEAWFDDTNTAIDTTNGQPHVRRPRHHAARTSTTYEVEANGSDWVIKALPRLEEVARLGSNWDGQASPGTDPEIVAAAVYLLTRLQNNDLGAIPAPFICPIPGGGLQFEWTSAQKHLELELPDKATIVFLKEELGPQVEAMDSGEYPLVNVERTCQLLDWFATL